MSEPREPLGPLLSNIPLPRPPKRLPPIFTKPLVRPRPSHTPSSSITQIAITSSPDQIICTPFDDQYEPGPSQKRVKRSSSPFLPPDEADRKRHVRMESMHDFFSTTSASRVDGWEVKEPRESIAVPRRVRDERVAEMQTVWRRPRRRLGIAGISRSDIVLNTAKPHFVAPQPQYLSTLVTSLAPHHPLIPPSILLLPSLHSPTGRPRDFAPPLSVAFNNIAKQWDASEARSAGLRRFIAVAGEEGGVRILDVDEGLGSHREEKGFWWRAHSNAVFDVKWSGDDRRILTASGDQTTRLHALTDPTPTLLATLRGHTSSIKTAVFFDPSRSHSDPSIASSIVASCSRDGNILIYDLRCQGRAFRNGSEESSASEPRRSSRERYSAGVPGFVAQQTGCNLDPVMVVRQAHGDSSRRASSSGRTAVKSVTSLIALQAMPGILASGGSSDGIVKLWDLRFPASTARSPDPRPICTPFGELPDPTIQSRSRRPRSVNALVESPVNGDLYALCGDSKVHVLRPSAYSSCEEPPKSEAIQPRIYTDPDLLVSSFYIRMAISPDGRYLSSGSCKGGVMSWETQEQGYDGGQMKATRLSLGTGGVAWPEGREREVSAVDWGKDLLAACADDLATRIWRPNREAANWLRREPEKAGMEWAGQLCSRRRG